MRPEPQQWPDAQKIVIDYLAGELSPMKVGSKVPAAAVPSVRVVRVGGGRTQVHDVARIALEVRHNDEHDAMAVANNVRDLLRLMPGQRDGWTVNTTEETGGPALSPDPVTSQPRVLLTVLVRIKPRDA